MSATSKSQQQPIVFVVDDDISVRVRRLSYPMRVQGSVRWAAVAFTFGRQAAAQPASLVRGHSAHSTSAVSA